ncbi:hypothetical protein [Erysipelothrix tonsillarum]|uniref:hypothetical protein n=1 Tax=Erysipelothrix tonsillarum TaxID=38402 RepID=UPI0039C82188
MYIYEVYFQNGFKMIVSDLTTAYKYAVKHEVEATVVFWSGGQVYITFKLSEVKLHDNPND